MSEMTYAAAVRRLRKHVEGIDRVGSYPAHAPRWTDADYQAVLVVLAHVEPDGPEAALLARRTDREGD